MRIRWSGLMVLALTIAAPVIAQGGAKLDDDDRDFLLLVEPIILDDEESTYKKLKDKADRLEFQKIFWARRDPDLRTLKNEFREKYLQDREIAATRFKTRKDPRPGWDNHCGRVFLLLGEPDQIDENTQWGVKQADGRLPETWTYLHDRPGMKIVGGRQEITFDEQCRGNKNLDYQLDKIAAWKVVQPNVNYRTDARGHLVKLSEQLPKDSAVRALIQQPRQDFPIDAQASFLKIADGGTGVFGLVRGDASTLAISENGGKKTVSLSIGAKAVAEDGTEAGWIEQAMSAPVGEDGAFLASFRMGLKPGKYTLSAGAMDIKGGKGSLVSVPIEVPDFAPVETGDDGLAHPVPSISSLVFLRSAEDMGTTVDPADPFAAYTLGTVRLLPHFGSTFRTDQDLLVFYQVYDLAVAPAADAEAAAAAPAAASASSPEPGKARAVASLRIRKDGKSMKDKATNRIDTPIGGSVVGPIPLSAYEPGRYQVILKLYDQIAGREMSQETWFEVVS